MKIGDKVRFLSTTGGGKIPILAVFFFVIIFIYLQKIISYE